MLADLGAEVTLVERPPGGDPSRRAPEFFGSLNRNKRSVCLDLKQSAGRDALLRLAPNADVLLEGFRPGTLKRLGLGRDVFVRSNPGLVFVSISGFGQDGPARDVPGHDLSYQALSGMLHRELEEAQPQVPWLAVGNVVGGLFAAVGVLAALRSRDTSGSGPYVDVSLFDALVSLMTVHLVPMINQTGPPHAPADPAYGLFRTADAKLLALSIAGEDHFWASFCEVAGLKSAAKLAFVERVSAREPLRRRVRSVIAKRTLAEWSTLLARASVPFTPVLELTEVADQPQVRARGMLVAAGTGRRRRIFVRQPLQIDGERLGPRRPAPAVGEHTRELLAAAGYSASQIGALLASGAAYEAKRPSRERAHYRFAVSRSRK